MKKQNLVIPIGSYVSFNKLGQLLYGRTTSEPNSHNYVGVTFEDGTWGYCHTDLVTIERQMVVETDSIVELIEKHGCNPNDMRHFLDDLELFYNRQYSPRHASLKHGASVLLCSLMEMDDSVLIKYAKSFIKATIETYGLKLEDK